MLTYKQNIKKLSKRAIWQRWDIFMWHFSQTGLIRFSVVVSSYCFVCNKEAGSLQFFDTETAVFYLHTYYEAEYN